MEVSIKILKITKDNQDNFQNTEIINADVYVYAGAIFNIPRTIIINGRLIIFQGGRIIAPNLEFAERLTLYDDIIVEFLKLKNIAENFIIFSAGAYTPKLEFAGDIFIDKRGVLKAPELVIDKKNVVILYGAVFYAPKSKFL